MIASIGLSIASAVLGLCASYRICMFFVNLLREKLVYDTDLPQEQVNVDPFCSAHQKLISAVIVISLVMSLSVIFVVFIVNPFVSWEWAAGIPCATTICCILGLLILAKKYPNVYAFLIGYEKSG